MPKRYAIRMGEGLIPSAVVNVPTLVKINPYTVHLEPVHRAYGLTPTHAYNRALRWAQDHGDPR